MHTTLIGLPGVAGGEKEAVYFESVTSGLRALDDVGAGTATGDRGALTIYVDDEGDYRCHFHRRRIPVDECHVQTKAAVRRWLQSWLPQLD